MEKRSILIVEDDEAIAGMIAINLKAAGYATSICYDGVTAAQALTGEKYDLALLDIMLPGMDGFEVFEVAKKVGVPAIFLTAKDDIDSKVAGLRGGAEDYLVKPFEVLELLVRVEKVLARNKKVEKTICFNNIEIDFEERTVKLKGELIHLKPKEYDLLVALVKNKNIAISREKLMNIVWGYDYFGGIHTVDVHIGQIRKKLELKDAIKTVSRVGYRLEVESE